MICLEEGELVMPEDTNKNEIDAKQKLKRELNVLIGKYIPNKIDLENFTNYIYKLTVITLKDEDIKKEYEKINGISEIDKQGFMRAIHTMALSSASNVMYQTLRETFNTLKNQVDLIQVNAHAGKYVDDCVSQGFDILDKDPNSTDFDLADLGNLGKVSQEAKENLEKNIEKLKEEDRRWEQERVVEQYRASPTRNNTWSSSDIEFNIDKDLQEFNMGGVPSKGNTDDSFLSDASSYSDGTYTKVPTVDKDLDY